MLRRALQPTTISTKTRFMAESSRAKRRRIDLSAESSLASLGRDVSPPPAVSVREPTPPTETLKGADDPLRDAFAPQKAASETAGPKATTARTADVNGPGFKRGQPELGSINECWPSPFRLTRIKDLPESENKDTVGISEILGDVMLREVWLFNYMHNIPWIMSQFDPDILPHVKINFVHGNWKKEDTSRILMEEQVKNLPNVKAFAAYMPEAFGTHHTKIMVLFRRDDTAQVIVVTANNIPFDWANMTQAAWISPILPLADKHSEPSPIGDQFKLDILEYFKFYGKTRCGPLVDELRKYSFSKVKGIFIGSVPGRHSLSEAKFGWPKLRKVLSTIPSAATGVAHVVTQCSSIATLGVKDTWLTPVLFSALSATATEGCRNPQFGIVFPTAQEIRDSLNGYNSGTSIHLRATSPAQQKQLTYLNPLFRHWSSESQNISAGRDRAAPHIKTYIRFSSEPNSTDVKIDWALVTSANISTQAWGSAAKDGVVRICSYEAGVLVHPGLWGEEVVMKPALKRDSIDNVHGKVVALRMPYGLPIRKYGADDDVWIAGKSYDLPDCLGQKYQV